MIKLRHIRDDDKQFFVGAILLPIIVWWVFTGVKRYSAKGMK